MKNCSRSGRCGVTECMGLLRDLAAVMEIAIGKTADPTKIAGELFKKSDGGCLMLTRLSEVIREWTGWCPSARTMRTTPQVITTPPVVVDLSPPDGGAAGAGRIDRGVNMAIGSIRFLFRNRPLLWFSFLIALVMTFNLAASLYLQVLSGTNPFPGMNLITIPPAIIGVGSPLWLALTFTSAAITSFLTYYLLAALFTHVSLILSGRASTIRDALSHAGRYLRPLAIWSVVWALIGTVYLFIVASFPMANGIGNIGITLAAMAIQFVIYVPTLYVIPALVVENKNLADAFWGSLAVFRKTWGEMVSCFGVLFLIAFLITLTSLVPMVVIGFSSGSTALASAVVVLYMLVLFVINFIGWTIVGIALLGLFMFGTTGTVYPVFAGKPEVQAPEKEPAS